MILAIIATFLHAVVLTFGQTTVGMEPYAECCDLSLMDSNLQVVIDTGYVLTTGTFTSLSVRVCSTDQIYIQIWTQLSSSAYQLKWQTSYTPTLENTIMAYAVVMFDDDPVEITSNDRLGLFNPSPTDLKFQVPYAFTATSSTYLSLLRFSDPTVFVKDYVIEIDDLRWPRTFGSFLHFCESSSAPECQVLQYDQSLLASVTSRSPSLFSGYIPASCCSEAIECDAGGNIQNSINNQNSQVANLQQTILDLEITIENLLNSKPQTGSCPPGFQPGQYGITSCYKIYLQPLQFAEAIISCRNNYAARLLNIQSTTEEAYVRGFLLNATTAGVQQFWTAAMFDPTLRNWYYFDDDLVTKQPLMWKVWYDNLQPAPVSINGICSVFTVIQSNLTDYLKEETCTNSHYYVCQVPKTCM